MHLGCASMEIMSPLAIDMHTVTGNAGFKLDYLMSTSWHLGIEGEASEYHSDFTPK
jgi:hypothetical protein